MGEQNGAKIMSAAQLTEIREYLVSAKQDPKRSSMQLAIDVEALLAHLDALTAPADGEALGREAWIGRANFEKWKMPESRVVEYMRASFDDQPPEEQARYRRIGLRCHARGYAAGIAKGEEERARHHEATRATIANLIEAKNLAQRTAEDAHREIARLTAERDAARDCGQADVCATPPGCARHWEERNRELAKELTEATTRREEAESLVAGMSAAVVEAKRDGARVEREACANYLAANGDPGGAMKLRNLTTREAIVKAREGGAG